MSELHEERLRSLLREALPPAASIGPDRDLWPRLRQRMERPPAAAPWLDVALAAAVVAGFIAFPQWIPWVFWQV